MAIPTVEEINEYNPWLKGEKFEVPSFKRNCYEKIKEEVEKRKFIVGIVGLRRIGKTILMKQIGNEIEGEKFFFSFDEEAYQNVESLKFVISHFLKIAKAKPFIFLDEIGRIKGWAGVLKKYHDLGRATFIISSSSYLHITKGKESLAGRLKDFTLLPWSFDEYLKLKGEKVSIVEEKNIERAYSLFERKYESETANYLKKGSFPEIALEEKEEEVRRYIKTSTIEKLIFEDLPKVFPVEDVHKLYDILIFLLKTNGSIVNYSNIGSIVGLSKDTVKRYVFYLYKSLIVSQVEVYGSVGKALRKGKKIYAACPSLAFAYQDYYNEPNLVENTVLNKLQESFEDVRFYRTKDGKEIDFVVNKIPIEVKWQSYVTNNDVKEVINFMEKFGVKIGIVISKKFDVIEKNSKKVYVLPLDFFLLSDVRNFLQNLLNAKLKSMI
jgi:predicted AAA+ superfamily ATPase